METEVKISKSTTPYTDRVLFLELFRMYISFHANTNNTFEKRMPGTIKAYTIKYNLASEFLTTRFTGRFLASKFDTSTIEVYVEWLRNKKKHSHNHIARVTEICKTVLEFGVKQKLLKYNSLSDYRMRRLPPVDPPYFSPEDVKAFENYKSFSKEKQKAADMFTIQLHTGFDYGDFKELNRSHIVSHKGVDYIVKARHKNGIKQIIPMSEKLRQLFEKYNYKVNLLTNPKYNLRIKDVAKELEIKTYLTAKTGRKLFMMNKLNNEGYSIQAVSKMGGHKSIATTETYYAKVDISLIHKEFSSIRGAN